MNFFEHQQRARQRTTLAVLLFIVATLAVVAATDVLVLGVVAFLSTDPTRRLRRIFPGSVHTRAPFSGPA